MTAEELTAEVRSLRKQLHWAVGTAYALLLAALLMFYSPSRWGLGSHGTVNFGTVRAERLEIVDGSGQQRGSLKVENQTPRLELLTSKGKPAFSLTSSDIETAIDIVADTSIFELSVSPSTGSTAKVRVIDVLSRTQTELVVQPGTGPNVTLLNKGNKSTVLYPPPR